MFEAQDNRTLDAETPAAQTDALQQLRQLLARIQGELKFQ